jgi:ring-1,2-phenylacetyl-CoA epoxidase subunit PaaD
VSGPAAGALPGAGAGSGPAIPAVARAWDALAAVPDPEVPAVSIVELGIVRDVAVDDDAVRVALTTTYSGCPATAAIESAARAALAGLRPRVQVDYRLAPPWTTDWIAPEAREKLRAFGIAPPRSRGADHAARAAAVARIDACALARPRPATSGVACPRCGSRHTRVLSQFGSTACKALYRCNACREPFDHFKPH